MPTIEDQDELAREWDEEPVREETAEEHDEEIEICLHECTSNCRRVGCDSNDSAVNGRCVCGGEWHGKKE